jgi:hypothetical protein
MNTAPLEEDIIVDEEEIKSQSQEVAPISSLEENKSLEEVVPPQPEQQPRSDPRGKEEEEEEEEEKSNQAKLLDLPKEYADQLHLVENFAKIWWRPRLVKTNALEDLNKFVAANRPNQAYFSSNKKNARKISRSEWISSVLK